MKLLVIYLYFAEPKGSGPATMRILSYIDFHNHNHVLKNALSSFFSLLMVFLSIPFDKLAWLKVTKLCF